MSVKILDKKDNRIKYVSEDILKKYKKSDYELATKDTKLKVLKPEDIIADLKAKLVSKKCADCVEKDKVLEKMLQDAKDKALATDETIKALKEEHNKAIEVLKVEHAKALTDAKQPK